MKVITEERFDECADCIMRLWREGYDQNDEITMLQAIRMYINLCKRYRVLEYENV